MIAPDHILFGSLALVDDSKCHLVRVVKILLIMVLTKFHKPLMLFLGHIVLLSADNESFTRENICLMEI